jgi:diguanylate cyclase (GGDEF)-like protein
MARRLPACVRAKDTVARLGGDEFIIVLEDVQEAQQAAHVADKLLGIISTPLELNGLELRMDASIGISLGPVNGTTGEEL